MKYYLYLTFCLLSFFAACEKSKTTLSGVIGEAQEWFESEHPAEISISDQNARKTDVEKHPIWNKAVTKQSKTGSTLIVVPLKYNQVMGVGNRGQSNLVIEKKKDGSFSALIAKGIATKTHLKKYSGNINADDFTGAALFYDWDENFKFGYRYVRGKPNGKIGRKETNPLASQICYTLVITYYEQVRVGDQVFEPRVVRTEQHFVCEETPDPEEEIDWVLKEDGGTYYQDGGTTTVDMTGDWQWPANPVNGQQVTYINFYGEYVTFEYSTELGGWVSKGLAYAQNSTTIAPRITNRPPEFNTGILIAMSGPALAEPTPVGEIVVATTAAVIGVIYLIRLADYLMMEAVDMVRVRDHCLELYLKCYYEKGYANCHTCQQYCITQEGVWDDLNCPLD